MHFDDDDYYSPLYVELLVRELLDNEVRLRAASRPQRAADRAARARAQADLAKLHAYHLYGCRSQMAMYLNQSLSRPLAYGFSFMYRRALYEHGVRYRVRCVAARGAQRDRRRQAVGPTSARARRQDMSLMEDSYFVGDAGAVLRRPLRIHHFADRNNSALKVVTGYGAVRAQRPSTPCGPPRRPCALISAPGADRHAARQHRRYMGGHQRR